MPGWGRRRVWTGCRTHPSWPGSRCRSGRRWCRTSPTASSTADVEDGATRHSMSLGAQAGAPHTFIRARCLHHACAFPSQQRQTLVPIDDMQESGGFLLPAPSQQEQLALTWPLGQQVPEPQLPPDWAVALPVSGRRDSMGMCEPGAGGVER